MRARREQKSHDDGGRRRQQWWLVDDNGHEHLAVVGEETDPRDGHYNYCAEKPFSLIRPLACQNRTKVHEYLEAVSHRLPDCLSRIGHLHVMQERHASSGPNPLSFTAASLHIILRKEPAALLHVGFLAKYGHEGLIGLPSTHLTSR